MNCANHPDRERIAFCQNCGKPLCQECLRAVGSAVYCEPCLAAKLASATVQPPAAGAYAYRDPASGINASGTAAGGGTYTYSDPVSGVYASGIIPPQMPSGSPKPALAFLLGFIPGVGAMYNEQYFKGIVHLVVFVVLVSLAHANGLFGLFIAGWEFYMAIEAHHTARARRDGLPLPNPFGLNELGERMGFGKAWGPHTAGNPYTSQYASPFGGAAAGAPAPEAPLGTAPGFVPPAAPPYAAPYPSAYSTPSYGAGTVPPSWSATPPPSGTPDWQQYGPAVPPVPLDAQVPYPGSRFPAGAVWLIGLGVLFLVANAGFFHGFSSRLFFPLFMIGLAVFIFVRKMTSYGAALSGDGSAGYQWRIFRALRGSIWIALVGLLFFLNDFDILSWGHSWPLFIIVAGVMAVLQRAAFTAAAVAVPYAAGFGQGYGYPAAPPATEPPQPTTAIVPSTHDSPQDTSHEQEGR